MSEIQFPICGLTEPQYTKLKAEHGELHLITVKGKPYEVEVPAEGDKPATKRVETPEYKSLHKSPDLDIIDAFLGDISKKPSNAFVYMFNATMLAKDEAFNENTTKGKLLCLAAGRQLNQVIDDFTAELKNL